MRPCRVGFTLVELLVVIGIIALLISILLPSLANARRAGVRVACLSNLRQMHVAYALYANDFEGRVPLGYSYGWKQYNYLLRQNTAPAYRWMGLLYLHGAFEAPEAFYCPAEQDPLLSYDTEANPWPPDESAPAGTSTRVGYGSRPMIGWPFPVGSPQPGPMPKLFRLSDEAILADLLHKSDKLAERHETGLNALAAHGGAGFVDADVLLEVEVDGVRWTDTAGASFDAKFNDLMLRPADGDTPAAGLWPALDAAR